MSPATEGENNPYDPSHRREDDGDRVDDVKHCPWNLIGRRQVRLKLLHSRVHQLELLLFPLVDLLDLCPVDKLATSSPRTDVCLGLVTVEPCDNEVLRRPAVIVQNLLLRLKTLETAAYDKKSVSVARIKNKEISEIWRLGNEALPPPTSRNTIQNPCSFYGGSLSRFLKRFFLNKLHSSTPNNETQTRHWLSRLSAG